MLAADYRSFLLPLPARLLFSAVIALTIGAAIPALKSLFGHSTKGLSSSIFWLIGPFCLAYLALLIPLAMQLQVYDRYVLVLMPGAIILFVRLYQRCISRDLPVGSAIAAAVYALLAIAGTHDWFAWQSARLAAIGEVRATGVPREKIQGGFEYDGWTQIENGGHINYDLIRVPSGAYDPHPKLPQVADGCRMAFAPFTPAVQPVYSVVFPPKSCLEPSKFPPVRYRTWLPPFSRKIYVQRIPGVNARSNSAQPGAGLNLSGGSPPMRK